MTGAKPVALAAAVLLAAACSSTGAGGDSGTAGFASYTGVLSCADAIAWGAVVASRPVHDGLEVTVDVDEWVHPRTGSDHLVFIADDPANEVGAPSWEVSGARLLVVLSEHGPPSPLGAETGARAVREWRDAESPRTPRDECAQA